MREASILFLWWVIFAGTHTVMSGQLFRSKLQGVLGPRGFVTLYTLIAVATLTPLCWYYGEHRHTGPQLWITLFPYMMSRDLNILLMVLAFALLFCGLVQTAPSSILSGSEPKAYGVTRLTRHPAFAAFFLFAIAHLLVAGALTDVVFFGGLVVYSWCGALRQDQRKIASVPGYESFCAETSFLPFGAIIGGQQPFPRGELRWSVIILGLVVFYLVRAFHPILFGGILMTL